MFQIFSLVASNFVVWEAMLPFTHPSERYSLVADSDGENSYDDEKEENLITQNRKKFRACSLLTLAIGILCCVLAFIGGWVANNLGIVSSIHSLEPLKTAVFCKNPSVRREWRTLSHRQKHEYLRAVQCLSTTDSSLKLNQTLHDDFPWIHSRIGNYCENKQ